jgi:energy-coupling factor transport system ATP-binding protein
VALYQIKDLTFTYPEGNRPSLSGVCLDVGHGSFVCLCGTSGSGKTTLLRHLKTVLTPHGEREGSVCFMGAALEETDLRGQASRIGFVLQNPDNQIVTDKVWHELAFGLESLGHGNAVIRRRVSEMASFFGIQAWYEKSVFELSGGQKQLLNLASVMAMQPRVLILDEPTSQLDPIAASEFIGTLKKINDEIGTTIILSEHRLEEVIPLSDRVVVMSGGKVVADETPGRIGGRLKESGDAMQSAMPAPTRVFLALEDGTEDCPVTVKEGRGYLRGYAGMPVAGGGGGGGVDPTPILCAAAGIPRSFLGAKSPVGPVPGNLARKPGLPPGGVSGADPVPVLSLKDVWFRYEKGGADILRDLNLSVRRGEFLCVVGGNGTGKTTMLNVLSGLNKPYRGKVRVEGIDAAAATHTALFKAGLALLPQDPQTLFTRKTIREDLLDIFSGGKLTREEKENRVADVALKTEIELILDMHPYDVSGGEQQRAALAKVLLTNPKILLLDEPTKGMDAFFKQKLARIFSALKDDGMTILVVSHDIEFCATHAERCALFFNGGIVAEGEARAFFAGNSFYTTAANRMARDMFADAVTAEDVIRECMELRNKSEAGLPREMSREAREWTEGRSSS